MARKLTTAQKVARILNDHHNRTCAGFYPSTGGRAFVASADGCKLYISHDFATMVLVPLGVTFSDHNGRAIVSY